MKLQKETTLKATVKHRKTTLKATVHVSPVLPLPGLTPILDILD